MKKMIREHCVDVQEGCLSTFSFLTATERSTKCNIKGNENKQSYLTDSLEALTKHLRCLNYGKEDMTEFKISSTLFCVYNT